MSEQKKQDKPQPTIPELEAQIAQARLDLTRAVDELTDRVHPKVQLAKAKTRVRASVREFTDGVTSGDPKSLAVLAAGLAAVGVAVTVIVRRR